MIRFFVWTVSAAFLIGALTPVSAQQPAATTAVTCGPARIKLLNDPSTRSTTSLAFVDMPGTTIQFFQGGKLNSCVIVEFTATVTTAHDTPNYNAMWLAPTLDIGVGSVPNHTLFTSLGVNDTRTAIVFFPSVSPGLHKFRMQYASTNEGTAVYVLDSTVLVHFVP